MEPGTLDRRIRLFKCLLLACALLWAALFAVDIFAAVQGVRWPAIHGSCVVALATLTLISAFGAWDLVRYRRERNRGSVPVEAELLDGPTVPVVPQVVLRAQSAPVVRAAALPVVPHSRFLGRATAATVARPSYAVPVSADSSTTTELAALPPTETRREPQREIRTTSGRRTRRQVGGRRRVPSARPEGRVSEQGAEQDPEVAAKLMQAYLEGRSDEARDRDHPAGGDAPVA